MGAGTINTLANALYAVFCRTGQKWQDAMQIACFDYLKKGGWYAAGPISLLSGLNPSPFVLVMHFFMVALYGVGRVLLPLPTPGAFVSALPRPRPQAQRPGAVPRGAGARGGPAGGPRGRSIQTRTYSRPL